MTSIPADLAKCDVPVSTAVLPDSPITDAAKLMNGKVTVVDANSLICGPQVCAPVVGNVLVFGDRHHLTWPYSKSTAPFLEPLLLKANQALAPDPDATAGLPLLPASSVTAAADAPAPLVPALAPARGAA